MSARITLLALRALQLLSAAVVLGTSADLYPQLIDAKNFCKSIENASLCNFYGLVPAMGFNCFVGALGLLISLIGLAACFVERIPDLIMMALDGLATLVFFAGGIALAVIFGKSVYDGAHGADANEVKADAAFGVIGGLVSIGLIVAGFMFRGRGKGSSSV